MATLALLKHYPHRCYGKQVSLGSMGDNKGGMSEEAEKLRGLVLHTLEPVYDQNAKILILGTIPSPKSREQGFYYSHPQNRFWRVLATVLDSQLPATRDDKIRFLHKNHIALWDVLQACQINGADDGSIREPVVNDISLILRASDIRTLFTTGQKAAALYKKYCRPHTGMDSICLPSTSPANCRYYTFDDLVGAYQVVREYLDGKQ